MSKSKTTSRSIATVRLPRMTASALVSLIVSLGTAFRESRDAQVRASKVRAANAPHRRPKGDEPLAVPVSISASVSSCARRLGEACDTLEEAVQRSMDRPDRTTLRRLARRYASRWRALRAFVSAFDDLDPAEGCDPVALRAAAERVFGKKPSLAFVRSNNRASWATGRQKLALVESAGLAEHVKALGGGLVLAQLRAEHDAFGAALGVTGVRRANPPAAVAASMEQARALVCEYVVKVSALEDAEVVGSAELVATLLAPIDALRQERRAPAKDGAPRDVPTPATPPNAPPAEAPRPTGTG